MSGSSSAILLLRADSSGAESVAVLLYFREFSGEEADVGRGCVRPESPPGESRDKKEEPPTIEKPSSYRGLE